MPTFVLPGRHQPPHNDHLALIRSALDVVPGRLLIGLVFQRPPQGEPADAFEAEARTQNSPERCRFTVVKRLELMELALDEMLPPALRARVRVIPLPRPEAEWPLVEALLPGPRTWIIPDLGGRAALPRPRQRAGALLPAGPGGARRGGALRRSTFPAGGHMTPATRNPRSAVAALLLLLGATAAEAALPKELEAKVTRLIEEELGESQAPGAAVAIVREGEVVYVHAFGVRSLEERTPVTPDTLFRLGSTTKMMTALALLDAAAKGRVSLDAPVRTYAKELNPALGKLTASEAERYTGTYAHLDLARYTVSWDGKWLVLKTDKEHPLERTGEHAFKTDDQQELAFVFKPGQAKAKYLHLDLLTLVRAGK